MKSFKIIETQNRSMAKVFYSSFQFELAIDRESFEKQSYSCQGDLVILQYATETTECVVFGYVVKLQKVAIGSSDDYNPNLRNYHNNQFDFFTIKFLQHGNLQKNRVTIQIKKSTFKLVISQTVTYKILTLC